MADQLESQDLISFGISNDVRFEKVLADAGHRCFMFDHTIADLPDHHPEFHWKKLGVSGSGEETSDLLSLESHLAGIDHSDRLLMKIDVEGAEWDVFSSISDETLDRFDQIVGEFHWFLRLEEQSFSAKVKESLRRITEKFTLFNVHANNHRVMGFVGGFPVADVLELSFVRRELVDRHPSRRLFPEPADKANNDVIADHALLFFPFLPTVRVSEIESMIVRVQQDRIGG